MGLARAAIKLIAENVRDHKLQGRVLVIGKQDVWGSEEDVRRWLGESGVTPANLKALPSLKPYFQRLNFIQDSSVFQLMGFKEVITLDNSAYEGADVVVDLNVPLTEEVAEKLGRFDLIVDAGCLEHIFNAPQVLKNFYQLANNGGVVVHASPSSNHVDHGFYMFSPTFFQDYYSANRWNVLCHYFFRYSQSYKATWKLYQYAPGALMPVAFGGLNGLYGVFIAARKQDASTCDANVQQGMYLAAWAENAHLKKSRPSADKWFALRERLKWYVPKGMLSFLMTLEAKVNGFGGVRRYLKHYKNL